MLRVLILAIVWPILPLNLFAQPVPQHDSSRDGTAESRPVDDAQNGKPAPQVLSSVRYFLVDRVDEGTLADIQNALVALQGMAENENRTTVLILEIAAGRVTFRQAIDVARELTSARYSQVRTVAWIPRRGVWRALDGFAAILPLACHEIVMHPDAVIGDIGRGQPVSDAEKEFVVNLVNRRHNARVTGALAAGLCDPQTAVVSIKVDVGRDTVRTVLVTREKLSEVKQSGVRIREIVTIKEEGNPWLLSGREAQKRGILTTYIAADETDLARIYNVDPARLWPLNEFKSAQTRLISIDGQIDDRLREFVLQELQHAAAVNTNLIVFKIDSPGGMIESAHSIALAIAEMDPKNCRSVAYIPRQAIGGGEMIALSCDQIIMHSDARLGPTIPTDQSGEWAESIPEKVLGLIRERLKQLALRKGRPPAVFEAMADQELSVYKVTNAQTGRVSYMSENEIKSVADNWNQGPVIPESLRKTPLNLTGHRAFELAIAERPVRSVEEFKRRFGISTSQVFILPGSMEDKSAARTDQSTEKDAIGKKPQSWAMSIDFWILAVSLAGGITYFIWKRVTPKTGTD